MNNNLKETLNICLGNIVEECESLKKDFYKTSSKDLKIKIVNEIHDLYERLNTFSKLINNFDEVKKSNNKEEINNFIEEAMKAIKDYQEYLNDDSILNNSSIEKKSIKNYKNSKIISLILAAALLYFGGILTGSIVSKNNKNYTNFQSNYEISYSNNNRKDLSNSTLKMPNQNVDVEIYGMSSHFTDASDDEQVMQRAQDIYDKLINLPDVKENYKLQLSVENIANLLRISNGQFPIKDGEIYFNSEEIGNYYSNVIDSYLNSSSFEQYGTNLKFKPLSVFYVEGSLAHEVCAQADELMSNVYEDIRTNDVSKFVEDSVKWGEFVNGTVFQNDFTGEYISIWLVDQTQHYFVLHSLLSSYGPSIDEYGTSQRLIQEDLVNKYNNSISICIPNCYDSSNKLIETPLSSILYDIDNTPKNQLAEKAGKNDEWVEENDSVISELLSVTKSTLKENYDNQKCATLKLK